MGRVGLRWMSIRVGSVACLDIVAILGGKCFVLSRGTGSLNESPCVEEMGLQRKIKADWALPTLLLTSVEGILGSQDGEEEGKKSNDCEDNFR